MPLVVLRTMEIYHGIVVDAKGEGPDGIMCVEENIPPDLFPLPEYIGRRGSYTEMDCRFLFKQVAVAIQCMHREGMAHRNLNMENVLSDIFVRN
jgi:serine/threonine protein kinase